MVAPYTHQSVPERRGVSQLLHMHAKDDAIIAIENRLADAVTLADIHEDEFTRIADEYKVDYQHALVSYRTELYLRYVEFVFSGGIPLPEGRNNLTYLQRLLKLDASTAYHADPTAVEALFRRQVESRISDGNLTQEEKDEFDEMTKWLGLPTEEATQLYAELAVRYMRNLLNASLEDQRLSPDEEELFRSTASSFGIKASFDAATQEAMARYRHYWALDQGPLQPIETDINLQRNELCYAIRDVEWMEYRRITRSVGYSGPTLRIRVAKGLSWRMGNLGVQRTSEDELVPIDKGRVYLTNKRLIFVGRGKTTSIRLDKILDVIPYQNGITVLKGTGRTPFLKFDSEPDNFAVILTRLIREFTEAAEHRKAA